MKNKKLALFLFLLLAISCNKKENILSYNDNNSINFKNSLVEKLSFSTFVDSITFIQLETNDKNLIGEVNRIIYDDGKYYIHSTESMLNPKILIFDSTGVFLSCINKKGNGPGEYNDFSDFTIFNDNIYIASYSKLIKYNKKGSFLEEYKLNQQIKEFLHGSDDDFIIYNFEAYKNENKLLSITNNKGEIKTHFFKRKEREAKISDYRINWRSLVKNKNNFYLNYPYCDTIFKISKENIEALYHIEFGNKKIPTNLFDESDEGATQSKKLSQLNDYMTISAIGIGDNFLYIGSINKAYQGFITLYSKTTKTALSSHILIDDMYIKGNTIPLIAQNIPHNMGGNYILWELDPKYIIDGYKKYISNISETDKEFLKNKFPDIVKICTALKEDDNPILLRIKVKNTFK